MGTAAEEKAAEANQRPADFDTLLESIGTFGRFQTWLCVLLVGGTTFICSLVYYTQVMILLSPPASCRGVAADLQTPDGCWARDAFNSSARAGDGAADSLRACTSWRFNDTELFPTLASEAGWVCGEGWRPAAVHAAFWAGNVAGSWLWGFASDTLGRRPAVLAAAVMYLLGNGCTLALPRSLAATLAARCATGAAHNSVTHLPYLLVVEFSGATSRTVPLLVMVAAWSLGGVVQPWIAHLLWSWRLLVIVASAPLLLVLLFYRFIPESACWLLTRGRPDEARQILQRVADVNGNTMDEHVFQVVANYKAQETDTAPSSSESLLGVIYFPKLLKNMLLITLLWMLACLCFYGHSQNTAHLGGSLFVSLSLGGAVELVATVVPPLLQVCGRRPLMSGFFITSGVCAAAYALAPTTLPAALRLSLALAGRMFIMGAYSTCLQYGPELFPTTIRGQSLALYETMGGIAIFISPYIVSLNALSAQLPMLIFAGMAVGGGVLTLLLPETKGRPLPQTIVEGDLY